MAINPPSVFSQVTSRRAPFRLNPLLGQPGSLLARRNFLQLRGNAWSPVPLFLDEMNEPEPDDLESEREPAKQQEYSPILANPFKAEEGTSTRVLRTRVAVGQQNVSKEKPSTQTRGTVAQQNVRKEKTSTQTRGTAGQQNVRKERSSTQKGRAVRPPWR